MKRSVSTVLAVTIVALATPTHANARLGADDRRNEQSHTHAETRASVTGTLTYSGTQTTSNGWVQNYDIWADSATGDVWGEGYTEDPTSIDATGQATRWLSYSHYNGKFDFLGLDDGVLVRISVGPSDFMWSQDAQGNWVASPTGPQASLIVFAVAVAVVAAVILSGDSGCSCGHNGGTPNHPGTNHPGD